ncbi:hypothetical protein FQN49_002707 [Arthroderma sp. PD_2]|nr:hypothetical protein FQN49_002707 [Arthroderma sp. PD_2]
MPSHELPSVIPAQLSFLTIFNPSLGRTDETLQDQIVFYYATPSETKSPNGVTDSDTAGKDASEEENKRLRHVGLAQGMVSFAKNFSNGEPVDSIETENSRIVLKELEPGWWILASIDLTKISSTQKAPKNTKDGASDDVKVEYSSRELSPPYLLSQQLSKAYSIFLIHHGPSLEDLYRSLPRKTICTYLDRFWTRFVWNWDVLLNGNPAIDLFSGMKLAGGGELGIGVGEEEWGSGEREVLEGFVSRTEGLIDMVVSRFGDAPKTPADNETPTKKEPAKSSASLGQRTWAGCLTPLGPQDGVMFSGTGMLSRKSLSHVSQWMEWVYRYGEDAYGVRDDPKSTRRKKRKKQRKKITESKEQKPEPTVKSPASSRRELPTQNHDLSPRIPPPLIIASDKKHKSDPDNAPKTSKASSDKSTDTPAFGTDKLMNIITLGYGSAWGNSSASPPSDAGINNIQPQDTGQNRQPKQSPTPKRALSESTSVERGNSLQQLDESPGRFIIGLRDDLENEESDSENIDDDEPPKGRLAKDMTSSKIIVRTLELTVQSSPPHEEDPSAVVAKSLQVVIYLYQPFMFLFLFEPGTTALSSTSLYRSIHHQLGPLQKSLLLSTSPSRVAERLSRYDLHQYPRGQSKPSPGQSLYDIIYEPFHQTIRTSLPNIPELDITSDQLRAYNNPKDASQQPPWNRADALNVYMQIINTYTETRFRPSELERICKTNRGWWVLWMRVPTTPDSLGPGMASSDDGGSGSNGIRPPATAGDSSRQFKDHMQPEGQTAALSNVAFLVRKASDSKQSSRGHLRSPSGPGFFRSIGGGFGRELEGWSATPGKLVEGVGLDAKKYIDALINLNR